jgi:peptidoglycan/xylan/chitin deacetylase (PgdA/CDA1 family)
MIARIVKDTAKRAFSSPLGWRVLGPVLRPPGVTVLCYHRILGADRSLAGLPVEIFAEQMRWVRANCDPIHPDEMRARAAKSSRRRPAVLITFDDGYRDYHDNAYPVLKELGIPALVFLATSFLDEGGMMWTDTVQWASLSTARAQVKLPWSGEIVKLTGQDSRAQLGEKARAHLKSVPDGERRQAVKEYLAELGDPPARERQMLTWDEVRRTLDLTTYGGHSHTHPILSRLDYDGADTEIRTCRERIAKETGVTPLYFAYPNGQPPDFTHETQAILRKHGFTIAYSTIQGIAGADTEWMAVKRLWADATTEIPDFVWRASGLSRW